MTITNKSRITNKLRFRLHVHPNFAAYFVFAFILFTTSILCTHDILHNTYIYKAKYFHVKAMV